MIKIGFIDNYLDEAHANSYPQKFLEDKKAQKYGLKVCYAYAKENLSPSGMTTCEWCKKHNIEKIDTIEELVDKSDGIVVLSPDHSFLHPELSEYALKSGKPVYIDKTFSENKENAVKMFELAKKYKTPMYSSSALRFAEEIKDIRLGKIGAKSCVATGPWLYSIYAIHIFEMIATVMKGGAKRMMSIMNTKNRELIIDYGNGRTALFNQSEVGTPPFSLSVEMPDETGFYKEINSSFDDFFMEELIDFFITKEVKVDSEETINLMAMLECGLKCLKNPFKWFDL